MKPIKVVHVPFTKRNPYQRLLLDSLKNFGYNTYGVKTRKFRFLNVTLIDIILANWKPDIIHLHWHHSALLEINKLKSIIKSIFFILQIFLLKVFRIKLVWTVHNLTNHENQNHEIEIFFCKYIGSLADAVITHCETAKFEVFDAYRLKHLYKIFVIPHGNYINFYTNTISSEEAKKRLMLPTKSIIFLFLGELRPYKGILELIQSFKKLNIFNSQNIGLVIAGRPINKQFAEKIKIVSGKNDNIYLSLESIPDNDLQIYLNAANIVVFPYKKVLTSGATLLALSFGKPIIAPSLGCIQDVFDKHGSFLYDPKDTKGLYGAMEKAITKRSNFRQMSIYNLEQAYKFNWQDIASRTHNVYLQILRK